MIRLLLAYLCVLIAVAASASAQEVVAMATIRAGDVVAKDALAFAPMPDDPTASTQELLDRRADAETRLKALIGMEAARTVYAGRVITDADIRKPTVVERNALVRMVYTVGGLTIETEGRALDRGSAGDLVRIMNLSSRKSVTGVVAGPNLIEVRG
ncbi:MAG: flagellar basal body P-ring formation chaperone FlgA [Pseudomonadota bacterium]